MYKKLTILTIAIILAGAGCSLVSKKVKPVLTQTSTPTSTAISTPVPTSTTEVDTSDWKTYTNKEYGFSFKYPEDWDIRKNIEKKEFNIFSSKWRNDVPEGGDSVILKISGQSIDGFIEEYNKSDLTADGQQLSSIISKEQTNVDNLPATILVGSTAIGLNRTYLFVKTKFQSYIISYDNYDKYHVSIIDTIKFNK